MSVSQFPFLVVSDGRGNVFEIPDLYMAGMSWCTPFLPDNKDLIRLPSGSDLFELPGRVPIGYDPKRREFVEVREYRGNPVYAVAAFMPPAYVQCYRSAYHSLPDAPRLALYSYTAVGWQKNRFVVAGLRIDPDVRHDPEQFDPRQIQQNADKMRQRFPRNRLLQHLIENCVFRYGCPNAKNFVLERWECPVPTSIACNADCVGCISKQLPASGVCASQDRLTFVPTVDEMLEFAVPHLEYAPRAIISFGQGCEGEPLLAADLIEEAIAAIRQRTARGVININTNGSRPDLLERLCRAGLDSARVSLNSAQPSLYDAYYRPKNYTFEDVLESLKILRQHQRWASLNYFVFPGLTDHPDEIAALERLIAATQINMIQARNLNLDPEWYLELLDLCRLPAAGIGIRAWIKRLKHRFPWLNIGYFNPYAIPKPAQP